MADKILATISMLMFLSFLGFLAIYIAKVNLWVIMLIVSAMAVFDFVKTLRENGGDDANGMSSFERAAQVLEDQDQAG
jgi:ABC-type iron transport system FetAB permease component